MKFPKRPFSRLQYSVLILTVAWIPALGCGASSDSEDDLANRMAIEHAEDTAEPSPAAEVAPKAPIVTRDVVYAMVDGASVKGFVAEPIGAVPGTPGVLVIQEWWGLNDNIKAMAERLAGEGYIALAVDLYQGEVAEDRDRAYALMQEAMVRGSFLEENLRQAHAYLTTELHAGNTGSIGWCFGGGWSLQTALLLPGELDAAVMYYGRVVTDPEILSTLETPILGLFAMDDGGIPVDSVRTFEKVMGELGKPASIHIYEGVDHAFANPTGTNYDAPAAEDAWQRTLDFLHAELASDDPVSAEGE